MWYQKKYRAPDGVVDNDELNDFKARRRLENGK